MIGQSAAHLLRHLVGLDSAQTQTTEAERDALVSFATGKRRLVEIGVFEGFNTRLLADAMSGDGTLFAIDPFFAGRLGVCWGKWIAHREIARSGHGERVQFIEQLSPDAAKHLAGDFDFIFIDGDHSLEGIQNDWKDWGARVETSGVIALHDSVPPKHNPMVAELGSCQYFQSHIRFDPRFQIADQIDSLTILRRC